VFVGVRALGTSGSGLCGRRRPSALGPPPPPRGFPRGPLGRVRARRDVPLWAVASTSSGPPPRLRRSSFAVAVLARA